MIIDWWFSLIFKVMDVVLIGPLNSWDTGVFDYLYMMRDGIVSLSSWGPVPTFLGILPIGMIATAIAAWFGALAVAFVLKLVFWVVGLVTGNTGSGVAM